MYHLTDNPQYRTSNLEIRILVNCNEQNFDKWIRLVSKSKHPLWRPESDPLRLDAVLRTEAVLDVDSKFFILDYEDFLWTPQINLWHRKPSFE